MVLGVVMENNVAEEQRVPRGNWEKIGGTPRERNVCCVIGSIPLVFIRNGIKVCTDNVGVNCLDCHKAGGKDEDGFRHKGQFISVIVTPKDCSRCHSTEFEQMDGSHHSKRGANPRLIR